MARFILLPFFLHLVTLVVGTERQHLVSMAGLNYRDCLKQCKTRGSCRSILYKRRVHYCRLYGEVLSDFESGTTMSPGVVYDGGAGLGEDEVLCGGTDCAAAETCDNNVCKVNECPIPTAEDGIHTFGNLRQIGSKIKYKCINHFTYSAHSICLEDGTWSPETLDCNTYAYAYSGTNTYRTSGYLDSDPSRFSIQTEDLNTCLSLCNSTLRCLSVNFSPGTSTCESTNLQTTADTPAAGLSAIAGWNHYYKILPISLHQKDGGRYAFTFAEGQAFCGSQETSMASYADLQMAFDMGYSRCQCGWLTDRNIPYLSSWFVSVYCDAYGVGVSQCWTMLTSDVFCKDVRFRPAQ